ncbi:MAG: tetratricopeptide repeat protein [Planctomycetota bacterium]|nr:tetratricopeptide repeat protein [Planctomycetota bacterium]
MPSLEQLQRALDTSPGDAFLLYGLAMEHARLGDHQAALDPFARAVEADPANPYHHYHMARSLEALGRAQDARAVLEAGLEQAKIHHDTHAQSELTEFLDRLEDED